MTKRFLVAAFIAVVMIKRFLVAAFIAVVWYLTVAYLPYYTIGRYQAYVPDSFGGWTMLETASFAGTYTAWLAIYVFGPLIILAALFSDGTFFPVTVIIYFINMVCASIGAFFSSGYDLLYGFYIHVLIMLFLPLIVGALIINYWEGKVVAKSNENSNDSEYDNIEKSDATENLEKK